MAGIIERYLGFIQKLESIQTTYAIPGTLDMLIPIIKRAIQDKANDWDVSYRDIEAIAAQFVPFGDKEIDPIMTEIGSYSRDICDYRDQLFDDVFSIIKLCKNTDIPPAINFDAFDPNAKSLIEKTFPGSREAFRSYLARATYPDLLLSLKNTKLFSISHMLSVISSQQDAMNKDALELAELKKILLHLPKASLKNSEESDRLRGKFVITSGAPPKTPQSAATPKSAPGFASPKISVEDRGSKSLPASPLPTFDKSTEPKPSKEWRRPEQVPVLRFSSSREPDGTSSRLRASSFHEIEGMTTQMEELNLEVKVKKEKEEKKKDKKDKKSKIKQ